MVRATLWTVGLFGAGTTICRVFPWPWTEPIVLVALGLAFLFVSGRNGGLARLRARPDASAAPAKAAPSPPLAARAPVERTA